MKGKRPRTEKPPSPSIAGIPPIWVVAGTLLVVLLVAYWNSFDASFVFDDQSTIQRNNAVRSDVLTWGFLSPRALLFLTFTLNHMLGGLNVWGYHLVNLLMHAANGFLVLLLGQHLFRETGFDARQSRIHAALAAGLFLIHPVQTEAVTYISSRSELLSTLFFLAGFLVFVRWPEKRVGFVCSVAVSVLYFFGLSSKETVITLPATIFLYDFLFRSGATFRMFRERWRFYATFVVATPLAIYFLITRVLRDSVGSQLVGNLSAWHYFLTELRVIVRYIAILFVPRGLNLDYDFTPSLSAAEPAVIASLVFLAALAVLAWKVRRKYPLATFSIFWFFITLSPTSSVVPINDVIFEHRLYLPLAGVCFAFPLLINFVYAKVREEREAQAGTAVLCGLLLILCLVGTYQRNRV